MALTIIQKLGVHLILIGLIHALNRQVLAAELGTRCQHDMDCTDWIKGSACSMEGVCECAPYFVQYNETTCLPSQLLGSDCVLAEQCTMKVANSSCLEGACRCVEGFLQFRKHTCLGPARPGTVCYSNAHCQMWDTRSHCDFLIPNLFGRCQCTSPARQFGGMCMDEQQEDEIPGWEKPQQVASPEFADTVTEDGAVVIDIASDNSGGQMSPTTVKSIPSETIISDSLNVIVKQPETIQHKIFVEATTHHISDLDVEDDPETHYHSESEETHDNDFNFPTVSDDTQYSYEDEDQKQGTHEENDISHPPDNPEVSPHHTTDSSESLYQNNLVTEEAINSQKPFYTSPLTTEGATLNEQNMVQQTSHYSDVKETTPDYEMSSEIHTETITERSPTTTLPTTVHPVHEELHNIPESQINEISSEENSSAEESDETNEVIKSPEQPNLLTIEKERLPVTTTEIVMSHDANPADHIETTENIKSTELPPNLENSFVPDKSSEEIALSTEATIINPVTDLIEEAELVQTTLGITDNMSKESESVEEENNSQVSDSPAKPERHESSEDQQSSSHDSSESEEEHAIFTTPKESVEEISTTTKLNTGDLNSSSEEIDGEIELDWKSTTPKTNSDFESSEDSSSEEKVTATTSKNEKLEEINSSEEEITTQRIKEKEEDKNSEEINESSEELETSTKITYSTIQPETTAETTVSSASYEESTINENNEFKATTVNPDLENIKNEEELYQTTRNDDLATTIRTPEETHDTNDEIFVTSEDSIEIVNLQTTTNPSLDSENQKETEANTNEEAKTTEQGQNAEIFSDVATTTVGYPNKNFSLHIDAIQEHQNVNSETEEDQDAIDSENSVILTPMNSQTVSPLTTVQPENMDNLNLDFTTPIISEENYQTERGNDFELDHNIATNQNEAVESTTNRMNKVPEDGSILLEESEDVGSGLEPEVLFDSLQDPEEVTPTTDEVIIDKTEAPEMVSTIGPSAADEIENVEAKTTSRPYETTFPESVVSTDTTYSLLHDSFEDHTLSTKYEEREGMATTTTHPEFNVEQKTTDEEQLEETTPLTVDENNIEHFDSVYTIKADDDTYTTQADEIQETTQTLDEEHFDNRETNHHTANDANMAPTDGNMLQQNRIDDANSVTEKTEGIKTTIFPTTFYPNIVAPKRKMPVDYNQAASNIFPVVISSNQHQALDYAATAAPDQLPFEYPSKIHRDTLHSDNLILDQHTHKADTFYHKTEATTIQVTSEWEKHTSSIEEKESISNNLAESATIPSPITLAETTQYPIRLTTSTSEVDSQTTAQAMLNLASRTTVMEPDAPITTTLISLQNEEFTTPSAGPSTTRAFISMKPTEIRKRVDLGDGPVSLGLQCESDAQCQLADQNTYCNRRGICDCIHDKAGTECNAVTTGCHPGTFQCRSSGVCISWFFVCDGRPDCSDASDEECIYNGKYNQSCPTQAFRCVRSGKCISRAALCDGKKQCPHGEDELGCNSLKTGKCPPHTFRCKSGECLPEYEYCNAIISCKDGSDEPPHLCGSRSVPNFFLRLLSGPGGRTNSYCPHRCNNGRCRSTAIICSGRDGCGDGTDEETCSVCRCPTPTFSEHSLLKDKLKRTPLPIW